MSVKKHRRNKTKFKNEGESKVKKKNKTYKKFVPWRRAPR